VRETADYLSKARASPADAVQIAAKAEPSEAPAVVIACDELAPCRPDFGGGMEDLAEDRLLLQGATDTTVEVFHAGTRVAVHPRSALKWHTRTLRQLDTGADPIVCRRSAPAPPAMVETIMRTTPHPEQGFRACLEPPSALHSSRINPRAGARG